MKRKKTEETEAVVLWYKRLRETNNDTFLPLFAAKERYLVLRGGAGSGKSIFAGRKILERVTCEPGHRFLVCRKVARTLRQSCFEQLIGQTRTYYHEAAPKINRTDLTITFQNGSVILFAGLDDVEKLKSIYDITGIWVEEASEISEADFNQLDIRLRTDCPYYLQMILSFNPVSINHWLKRRFFDRQDERARVHNSTYLDNRFLTAEAAKTLEAFRETDPYYYAVYCLNQWGVTGKTVFDAKKLGERLQQLVPPKQVGYFTYQYDGLRISGIQWVEDATGYIRIYEPPNRGDPYVIGGDTAGDGSDQFVGQVISNLTGRQVAVLRHPFDEDLYARQMYCLGLYYEKALMGIEANFSTFPNKELARLGYPNLYVREVEDSFGGEMHRSFGFKTTQVTRPLIIAGLIEVVREQAELLNDETTILEMLTFVRNEKLRPEAERGAHDDTVMALAIAYHIRSQQRTFALEQEGERKTWTEDMWEDYRNASQEERTYLRQKWGTPKGKGL